MVIESIINLAQTTPTGSNPLGVLANYADLGVIVLFFGLFYAGKFRRESEVKERDAEILELKQSLEKYIEHYQKEVLPALIEVTRVSAEYVAYLNRPRD